MVWANPFLCGHGMLVTIILQDIAYVPVLARTNLQCHSTASLQSFLAIVLGQ